MTAFVVAAYAVTVMLIGGYALSIALRARSTERALLVAESDDNEAAGR
jgi:CcmD family protein